MEEKFSKNSAKKVYVMLTGRFEDGEIPGVRLFDTKEKAIKARKRFLDNQAIGFLEGKYDTRIYAADFPPYIKETVKAMDIDDMRDLFLEPDNADHTEWVLREQTPFGLYIKGEYQVQTLFHMYNSDNWNEDPCMVYIQAKTISA